MNDILEGWWLAPDQLAEAVAAVALHYEADTLVVRPEDFDRLFNAIFVHPSGAHVRNAYLKIGINTIVPNPMPVGTFEVSSGLLTDGSHIRDAASVDRIRFVDLDQKPDGGLLPPTPGCLFIRGRANT